MERRIEPAPEPAVVFSVFGPMVMTGRLVNGEQSDRPTYGYASPHRRVYMNAPFYNWRAFTEECAVSDFYWPMVRGQPLVSNMVDVCDDGSRTLLIYNEPELGRYHAEPDEAVIFVHDWAERWHGPIVCCGNFYDRVMGAQYSGLGWFRAFVAEWEEQYGSPPPLAALHLHVYEFRSLNLPVLEEWRALADDYGWPIYVTESGTFPSEAYSPEEVAARLPGFLGGVEQVLQPAVVMWFSDYIEAGALGPDAAAWERFNLYTKDGALTVVAKAWQAWIYR